MKYYCDGCGCDVNPHHEGEFDIICPICGEDNESPGMVAVPDYETTEQYKKRTGEEFPGSGLVWMGRRVSKNEIIWDGYCQFGEVEEKMITYLDIGYNEKEVFVVIADPLVPPPNDFMIEKEDAK